MRRPLAKHRTLGLRRARHAQSGCKHLTTPRMTQTHRNLSEKPDNQEGTQPKNLTGPPRLKNANRNQHIYPESLTQSSDPAATERCLKCPASTAVGWSVELDEGVGTAADCKRPATPGASKRGETQSRSHEPPQPNSGGQHRTKPPRELPRTATGENP